MCRVAVRRNAQSGENVQSSQELFTQLNNVVVANAEIDNIGSIFDADVDEQDLDFLELFQNETVEPATEEEPAFGNITNDQSQQPAVQVPAIQQFTNPASMIYPTTQLITPEQLQQQYTQAIIQQQMIAQLQTSAMAATAPPTNRRGKTPQEIAEQQERIKKRRRESAQRSRQRKSAYVKSLECENHALKMENEKLRKELERLGTRAAPPAFYTDGSVTTSGSSPGVKTESPTHDVGVFFNDSNSSGGGADNNVGLYPLKYGSELGVRAAEEFMGMVL